LSKFLVAPDSHFFFEAALIESNDGPTNSLDADDLPEGFKQLVQRLRTTLDAL
jgi:hypothetical protein